MHHRTKQQNPSQLVNDKNVNNDKNDDPNDDKKNNDINSWTVGNGKVVNVQVQCLVSEKNKTNGKQVLQSAQMADKDNPLIINENDDQIINVYCQNQYSNHSLIEPPTAFQDYQWISFDARKNNKNAENFFNFYSHNQNEVIDVAYDQSPSPSFNLDDNNLYEDFTISPTSSIVILNNKQQFQKTNDQNNTNMSNNSISGFSSDANQYQLYHRLLQHQNSPIISPLKHSDDQTNPSLFHYTSPAPPPSTPLVISKTETTCAGATGCSTSYSPLTSVCYDSSPTSVSYHLQQYPFRLPHHRLNLFQPQSQPLQRNAKFQSPSIYSQQQNHHYQYHHQLMNRNNHYNPYYQQNYQQTDMNYSISPLLSTCSTPLPSNSLSATISNSTILRKPQCSLVNTPVSCMENSSIDSSIVPNKNSLQSYNHQVIINNKNQSNFIKGNSMTENNDEIFKTTNKSEVIAASMETTKSNIETAKTTAIEMMAMVEEQVKQEAQLRELKGYEASAKYQPPLIDTGTVAAALLTQSGTIIPDLQSHKRSCSQWRMTLFVFYWIIWIVFLIGVVIIVAANTRTE